MALVAFASMTDQLKPDSTGTLLNGDAADFLGPNSSIVASSLLAPGTACLQCDMSASNIQGKMRLHGSASTEFCITFVYQPRTSVPTNQIAMVWTGISNSGYEIRVLNSGGLLVLTVYYDGVQLFTSGAMTLSNIYRVGIYIKQGTLGVANSTVSFYMDDVTAGDIAVGAAGSFYNATSSTVTFTNAPTLAPFLFGASTSFTNQKIVHRFQHIVVITADGSVNNRPDLRVLDPLCVSRRSVPTGYGHYQQFTTPSWTNLTEIPPDDATSVAEASTAGGLSQRQTCTMAPWSTVGNTSGDTILGVRSADRHRANSGGVNRGTMRSGAVDVDAATAGLDSAWTTGAGTYATGSAPVIQETDPATSAAWTIAGYNKVEVGVQVEWSFGDSFGDITWLGLDAVFIRGSAVASARRRGMVV